MISSKCAKTAHCSTTGTATNRRPAAYAGWIRLRLVLLLYSISDNFLDNPIPSRGSAGFVAIQLGQRASHGFRGSFGILGWHRSQVVYTFRHGRHFRQVCARAFRSVWRRPHLRAGSRSGHGGRHCGLPAFCRRASVDRYFCRHCPVSRNLPLAGHGSSRLLTARIFEPNYRISFDDPA